MRFPLLIASSLAVFIAAGCTSKIDGSTPESTAKSIEKMVNSVPESERRRLVVDLNQIAGYSDGAIAAAFEPKLSAAVYQKIGQKLDGYSLEDVRKLAARMRKEEELGRAQSTLNAATRDYNEAAAAMEAYSTVAGVAQKITIAVPPQPVKPSEVVATITNNSSFRIYGLGLKFVVVGDGESPKTVEIRRDGTSLEPGQSVVTVCDLQGLAAPVITVTSAELLDAVTDVNKTPVRFGPGAWTGRLDELKETAARLKSDMATAETRIAQLKQELAGAD